MLFDVAVLRTELAGADAMLENDVSLGVLAARRPHRRRHHASARNIIGERILASEGAKSYPSGREAERLVAVGDAGLAQCRTQSPLTPGLVSSMPWSATRKNAVRSHTPARSTPSRI